MPSSSDTAAAGGVSRRADALQAAIGAFAEVAGALGEVRELDALLHLVAQKITVLAGVRRCSIYLRDEETGHFHGQVGHADTDIDAQVKRLVAGIEADAFTREILETKAPVVINDAMRDPRPVRSAMRDWKIRAMMGVPMILKGEVIGLVFLDDEDRPHPFSAQDEEIASTFADLAAVAIGQAQMTATLRSSVETVARQNDLLRRASAVEDKLSSLVLQGGNLRDIAQAVAQLTSKPCAIYDARYERLALAHAPGGDADVVPGLLEPEFRTRPAVAEALSGIDGTRGGVLGPIPVAGLHHRFLIAPVTVRDDRWGHLVLMEHQTRLGPLDMHICRRAATNIALEMSAERRATSAELNAQALLAAEMIRGTGDPTWLSRRADYLGVRLDVPRVVCLVTVNKGEGQPVPEPRKLVQAVAAENPERGVLATTVAEGVVLMLELPEGEATTVAIRAAKHEVAAVLRRIDPGQRLHAGVSSVCRASKDYVSGYGQARQVSKSMQSFRQPGAEPVLSADDLGAGRLLLSTTDPAEAARFADETLGPLLDGADGMADLLTTLRVFFDTGRSVRNSAAELGVHENTVRYRLSRIEEVTGLPIAVDADAQLSAQLALLVLRLQGRFADAPVPVH
jgi:sugar diacid utilization regulator